MTPDDYVRFVGCPPSAHRMTLRSEHEHSRKWPVGWSLVVVGVPSLLIGAGLIWLATIIFFGKV